MGNLTRYLAALALVVGSVPCVSAPPAGADTPCLLRVDDHRVIGDLGDSRLSLGEAIEVVAQRTAAHQLSPEERNKVRCHDRGPATIVVDRRAVDVIKADGALPPLKDVDGLVIDGRGVRLNGNGQLIGFDVASSRLTFRSLRIHGYTTTFSVKPHAGVRNLRDLLWVDLDLTVGQFGIDVVAGDATGSTGTIDGVTIRGSRIHGSSGAEATAGINITAMTGPHAGRIRNVTISDNDFGEHLLERIQLVGIQGLASGDLVGPAGPELAGIRVSRNRFRSCPDPCVLAYASLALGGQVDGAGISDVFVTDNSMRVSGLGVTVIGGYTLGPGSTSHSVTQDVTIARNLLRSTDEHRCAGIGVFGAWTDFHAGDSSGGTVKKVRISDNQVAGCETGILISGTHAVEEVGGVVRGARVRDVVLRRNRLSGNDVGLMLSGASMRYGRVFGNSPTSSTGVGVATLVDNSVADVRVLATTLIANQLGIFLAGASVAGTNGHLVTGNQLMRVTLRRTSHLMSRRRCLAVNQHAPGTLVVAVDNRITGARC